MSKFNKVNTNKTTNKSGYAAYKMEFKERLVTAVLTSMFGEPKFYGSEDDKIIKLASQTAKYYPEFLANLTVYARNEMNLRSISHVLACVIAHDAKQYTREVIDNIVIRPDDITEIMACYVKLYGKPFPNAMKREIAKQMCKFDEYGFAKYNGKNKSMKFKDVLKITHPTPNSEQQEVLFKKILNDTLETPYTWEVELSTKGNTKEVWDELISSNKVGYMALLRNLRNIINSGADITPVLEKISNPEQIRRSKQLPFRYYAAYKALLNERCMSREIHATLEKAIQTSIENMDIIKGRTLIAIDTSGSMGSRLSAKSDICCCDIATLLGAMASHICEDATVCYFNAPRAYNWYTNPSNNYVSKGYTIKKYGKYDSILAICEENSFTGGGTNLSLPMKFALKEDKSIVPFDRVIYFSDNECNSGFSSRNIITTQSLVDEYRKKFNKDFWVHAVDLQGYGTQQFIGDKFNVIAGWSEAVLPFINTAEEGIGSMVKMIEDYKFIKKN